MLCILPDTPGSSQWPNYILLIKLALLRCPSTSPTLFDDGPVCIARLTRSQPPSVSPNSLRYCLPINYQTLLLTASKCISNLARLQQPCLSRNVLCHGFGVQHSVYLIMMWWNGGGWRQTDHQPHSATVRMASDRNSWETPILAWTVQHESNNI